MMTFVTLSVLGSLAIFGWHIVTRGEYTMTPVGGWRKTGMIFKHWSIFLEQYKKTKEVFFEYGGLREKHDLLKKIHPAIAGKLFYVHPMWLKQIDPLSDREIEMMKDALLCKFSKSGDMIRLSVDQPIYIFPEWVQKPFSSCPTCMAGPYGTVLWLVFIELQRDAFAWTDHIIFAKIAFGMLFLLTLATVNTFISKKIQV